MQTWRDAIVTRLPPRRRTCTETHHSRTLEARVEAPDTLDTLDKLVWRDLTLDPHSWHNTLGCPIDTRPQ